jgi:hypothetical protein
MMKLTCVFVFGAVALVSCVSAQQWAGPYQLTCDAFADINPSACKEWLEGGTTCLVWQTNRSGNWDVYAKFGTFMNGNGWGTEEPICTDSADDVNPVVACCNDWSVDHPSYWCVWERRESPAEGSILASFVTFRDLWGPPESIGRYIHTSGDSAEPGIIAIGHDSLSDTTWVTWTCHDTDGWRVEYSFNVGDSWTEPMIAIAQANPIHHARLGRGYHGFNYGCPLLVWETNGDIYYSEHVGGSWNTPRAVTQTAALDRNPEVISLTPHPWPIGPAIVWESAQDGDTAIFGTADDSFIQVDRWCDSSGSGGNWMPCGTPTLYTAYASPYWVLSLWVSDRAGNPDIYVRGYPSSVEDGRVDSDPADDVNPTATTMGLTMNWCLWQSNRSGNWDIWGSYVYATGVTETRNAEVQMTIAGPTVVRGVLTVPASGVMRDASCVLLDAAGRNVMALHEGANDVSGLAPGVYFMRSASDVERLASSVRKVVVLR